MQAENKYVFAMRTCLLDGIFSYIMPTKFGKFNECNDLRNLMICNKDTKKLMTDKFLENVVIPSSIVETYKLRYGDRFNKITRIFVNEYISLSKNLLPCNLKE